MIDTGSMTTSSLLRLVAWTGIWLLISVVMVFLVLRISIDASNLSAGTFPPIDDFDHRYARRPLLAYLHILPGAVYLLAAPHQLSRRLRSANLRRHRAVGRVVVVSGLISGVFAVGVGLVMPFGGWLEAAASVVFGSYFVVALVLAYRAIRSGRTEVHRRWMIRAFAIGVGVGTIRIWVGVFQAVGLLGFQESFGPAFWLAFTLHATAAEAWLRLRPQLTA